MHGVWVGLIGVWYNCLVVVVVLVDCIADKAGAVHSSWWLLLALPGINNGRFGGGVWVAAVISVGVVDAVHMPRVRLALLGTNEGEFGESVRTAVGLNIGAAGERVVVKIGAGFG